MPKVSKLNTQETMLWVIGASLPALCVLTYWQGHGFLINLAVAMLAGWFFDSVGQSRTIDYSTIVCAILFASGVPAFAPAWVPVIGMFFAIVVAKRLYGGLGYNVFNPAMVGYAVVLIAFPTQMVIWPTWSLDSISAATPLDHVNTGIIPENIFPFVLLNAAWLLGGLILMFKKIIRWMIPAGVLLGMLLPALFFPDPLLQWALGSTMICAFFIATDPVTAPATPYTRLIYGLLIGMLIIMMRQFSSYPDGVAFAVLLANLCTPLMDQLSIRTSQ